MQRNKLFLPEGMNGAYQSAALALKSFEDIKNAAIQETPLETIATRCDTEHNLHTTLCGYDAIIPREEAILSCISGSQREISVLSKVGKYICFTVKSAETDDEGNANIILSRKTIQNEASQHLFSTLLPGDILPVTITHLAAFGAFVDMGCGVIALIPLEHISVSRIAHPRDRFSCGAQIYAAVSRISLQESRIWLTHRELLGTWLENTLNFAVGETVQGIVRGIMDYGVFVELTPNLCGLAEGRSDLSLGDMVSVFIKAIVPQKMKIKLQILEKLPIVPKSFPVKYYMTEGHLDRWDYAPDCCDKSISTDFTSSS